MNTRSFATILLTAMAAAGGTAAGCSGSNNPSNTNSSGNPGSTNTSVTTNTTGASSSTTTSTGATSTSVSTTSGTTTVSDAGAGGAVPACPSGLEDKITTCTATDLQACNKGCGPDLPPDSGLGQSNLGTKTCTCTTGVYQCADCAYVPMLPLCYQEMSPAPACEAGVADKLPCGTACTTGTGNDVCSTTSDAGKTEGCVCISNGTANVWTCATTPW